MSTVKRSQLMVVYEDPTISEYYALVEERPPVFVKSTPEQIRELRVVLVKSDKESIDIICESPIPEDDVDFYVVSYILDEEMNEWGDDEHVICYDDSDTIVLSSDDLIDIGGIQSVEKFEEWMNSTALDRIEKQKERYRSHRIEVLMQDKKRLEDDLNETIRLLNKERTKR